ncbi:helix-turn-helix transcriptional regulator [Parasphingorhabdus sp. JC815]|uniref:helix-turn-helix domain-containing protein n=1 Tax=Parasphingorhabdus sp. JC815 TaxID=3232140 RepID=UPI003458AF65
MTYSDTLKAYLSKEDVTQAVFAEMIKKKQATVNRYVAGVRFPDADTARDIENATNGGVPFAVWQTEFLQRSGVAA